MSVLAWIFRALHLSARNRRGPVLQLPAEEAVIKYLVGFINRADLIAEQLAYLERIATLTGIEKSLAYAKLYLQLETFLVKNKPLVTKKEFASAQEVRTAVAEHLRVSELSVPVRLIFLPENEQAAYLFNIALSPLIRYIREYLGEAEYVTTVEKAAQGTFLDGLKLEGDTFDLDSLKEKLTSLPHSEILVSFRKVCRALLDRVVLAFGQKSGSAIAGTMYNVVAGTYDQAMLSLFLDVMPEGILEPEKLVVLSREELEKRVVEATEALKAEKEGVEKKVIERTNELNQKVKELFASNELLKKREEELTEANNRLTELDKIKTEFISVAAHQLRTPLSAIKWILDSLMNSDADNLTADQRGKLFKAYESNERMLHLIGEMLVVTRIESGKMRYEMSAIHIEDLVDSVLLDFDGQAKPRSIRLSFHKGSGKLPLVHVDPEKVRAVIQNLVENALSYTKDGGEISVAAEREGEYVRVIVQDNGIGIPEHQQSSLFNKFFRADNAAKVKTDGSGLGLFVAKSVIDQHGGSIGFESKEGEGSTFYFTVPIEKEL